uniref:Uncharacterized protein n=1 Tax=Arundo donax TaxID=35708 RepID=A0A0A9F4S1_ARUDO
MYVLGACLGCLVEVKRTGRKMTQGTRGDSEGGCLHARPMARRPSSLFTPEA